MRGTGETLLDSKNDLSVAQRNKHIDKAKLAQQGKSRKKRVRQDTNWPSKFPWPRSFSSFIPEVGGGDSSSAHWWDLNFTVWWDWMEDGFGKHESLLGYLPLIEKICFSRHDAKCPGGHCAGHGHTLKKFASSRFRVCVLHW